MSRLFGIAFLLCAATGIAQQSSRPTSAPTTRPDGRAAVATAKGSKEALALAGRIVAFAGGPEALKRVDNLIFSFGVGDMERRMLWDRRAGKVRVETVQAAIGRIGPAGFDVMVHDLANNKQLVRHPPKPKLAPKTGGARTIWINDTYWLLVSLKVLDPGVNLSIDPAEEGDSKLTRRLRMTFDKGVGMSYRNTYVLHVENDTGRIRQWDFYRSPRTKEPRVWRFEDYKRVGPLRLSMTRRQVIPEGSRHAARDILLTEVAVNVAAPKGVWSSKERILPLKIKPTSRPTK